MNAESWPSLAADEVDEGVVDLSTPEVASLPEAADTEMPREVVVSGLVGVSEAPRRRPPWLVVLAAGWILLFALLAVFASVLPLRNPKQIGTTLSQAPGLRAEFLGTDDLGRSELSRIVYGARVSLAIGLGATLGAMAVGLALGTIAGYFRGLAESTIDVVTTTMLAFPPLIFLMALTSVLAANLRSLVLILGLLGVPLFTRIARASTISYANRDFVLAARSMGATNRRVLLREIAPNVLLPVVSFGLVSAAVVIVAEGSLSFLGLGIRAPQASWGGMVAAGKQYMSQHPHLVFVPAAAFIGTVFSLNVLGDWARARFSQGRTG
jgi:peptide/nickel transport system permease protein